LPDGGLPNRTVKKKLLAVKWEGRSGCKASGFGVMVPVFGTIAGTGRGGGKSP